MLHLSLLVLCAVRADAEPLKKQKVSVAFQVPSSAEKAHVAEVRQVGKELWVRIEIKGAGGFGLAVISTVRPEAVIHAPALPVKYLVFGKTWGWKNEEKGIVFLKDLDAKEKQKVEKAYAGGKAYFKAK